MSPHWMYGYPHGTEELLRHTRQPSARPSGISPFASFAATFDGERVARSASNLACNVRVSTTDRGSGTAPRTSGCRASASAPQSRRERLTPGSCRSALPRARSSTPPFPLRGWRWRAGRRLGGPRTASAFDKFGSIDSATRCTRRTRFATRQEKLMTSKTSTMSEARTVSVQISGAIVLSNIGLHWLPSP